MAEPCPNCEKSGYFHLGKIIYECKGPSKVWWCGGPDERALDLFVQPENLMPGHEKFSHDFWDKAHPEIKVLAALLC